ncbi:MAG: hypothetical protein EZS28_026506, partial [Streblomastix strix]
MAQLENEIKDSKLFESILSQQTNTKQITIAKGVKRSYNRKSKVNEKAKALVEQMMNEENIKDNEKDSEIISEIVNEVVDVSLINETISEPIIEQTNKETHEKILHDLRNAEGDQESRLAKQQEAYRLEKQWKQEGEQEPKQNEKEEFDKRANKVINELTNEEDKRRIAAKIACLKLMQEEHENPMSEYEKFSKMISDAFDASRDKLNQEEKEKIRQNNVNNLLPSNVGLVQTARGGILAYCNRNEYKLPSNKNEKVVTYEDSLEIDIFVQMYTHKDGKLVEIRVVLPDSKVRIMDKGIQKKEILHYKELNDWSNATHLASLFDILGKWNFDLTAKDKDFSIIIEDYTLDTMLKDIADPCIDGLKGLPIHNDTNTLDRDISLLPLFMGLF